MKIAGFQKQSLIDFPGNITAVVFTQGCNFRCSYCHNPNLVLQEKFEKPIAHNIVFDYLSKYKKLLDAVCITGGEPTLHPQLNEFIVKIKRLNLKVKLDTNGTNPDLLCLLIKDKLVDFISMDIKNEMNPESYQIITGNIGDQTFEKVLKSVKLIKAHAVDYEFRTTVLKNIHTKNIIRKLKNEFGEKLKLQNFRTGMVLKPKEKLIAFEPEEFEELHSL